MTSTSRLALNMITWGGRLWNCKVLGRHAQDKTYMYYVYVLQSTLNKDVYVGYTTDLKNRFKLHNSGKVKSTKPYKPWVLSYYEAYKEKLDATKREKELKSHAAKQLLLKRLGNSIGK